LQITRLRIAGFKSFVEPTELRIEPGLTGIVGPNGCGKSNLVEALRWAMGESAARRMRATELEDVIFAGTAARPARNFAEVALALDNQAGLAPHPYRDQPTVEVVRRLPRGGHSAYRVNGRAARARDVQQMLADASTGARSTAIVAQGQIGAFVAAKPTERRGLLEEAAGVAGLYSRRQEAETRLRAARPA
jgi:chromosome segregation protein